jgi:hypothetical protein
MNEASAREVLLLQVVETNAEAGTRWTAQDAAWASRAALESTTADATADAFVAERAHHAMQRLAPMDPAVAGWLQRRAWRGAWWPAAAVVGVLAGLAADAIGSGRHINLLAPPVWGVVAWNLLVYGLLLWGGLRAAFSRRVPSAGGLTALVQRVLGPRQGKGAAALGPAFSAAWSRHGAPLATARAAGLLHTAAGALGLGLLAGMYARGLVLDYRAGWESTFLDAAQVHAALQVLLAPALALSGQALPDPAALEPLRFTPAHPLATASAAPWIHLYALTLLLTVVLPRSVLALWSGWRAGALARRFPLPLDDAYFQRLLRHRQGGAARVQVLPYAQALGAPPEHGLRAVLAQLFGEAAQVLVAPMVAFGAEDELSPAQRVAPGTTLAVALFDLTATPEAENQGRFVELLARQAAAGAGGPAAVVVLVDESAFVQRFGPASERLAQRRAAWRTFADTLGTAPVLVNLAAPDLPAAERALQAAAERPARAREPSRG